MSPCGSDRGPRRRVRARGSHAVNWPEAEDAPVVTDYGDKVFALSGVIQIRRQFIKRGMIDRPVLMSHSLQTRSLDFHS